jgi:hypothetical protein
MAFHQHDELDDLKARPPESWSVAERLALAAIIGGVLAGIWVLTNPNDRREANALIRRAHKADRLQEP